MFDYAHQEKWPNGFGKQQSPIDLSTVGQRKDAPQVAFRLQRDYHTELIRNDRTTIQMTAKAGQCRVENREFTFKQVHFHFPAEHLVNGQATPFEVHFAHQNALGQLLVIGLLISVGDGSPVFDEMMDHYDPQKATTADLNLTDWLNINGKHAFHYLGSLTTPPLTEGVEWLVVTNPLLTISGAQLARYQTLFKANNRHVQALNDRIIDNIIL